MRPKGHKGQDHWERKCKNRFRAYIRGKWIDLQQTNTRMITGPFYTHRQIGYISPAEMHNFCDICLFLKSSFANI